MRVFYDCEFLERGPLFPIELISLGMVADDGRELYVINGEFGIGQFETQDWLRENVLPSLPISQVDGGWGVYEWDETNPDYDAHVFNRKIIAEKVTEFVEQTPKPELWGYCSAYDHVILAQIFGTMQYMHPKLKYYTNDIAQVMYQYGIRHEKLPALEGSAHKAIDDARWTKQAHDWLIARISERESSE